MYLTTKPNWLLVALFFLSVVFMSGCAHVRTDITEGSSLKNYNRAYIEALSKDEFQIYGALFSELSDMGMVVVESQINEPAKTDLIVKYTYESGWDMRRYLQSFQLRFIDAKNNKVVAVQSYSSSGIWRGARDGRLKAAFNELRAKNGYPPSKQFP